MGSRSGCVRSGAGSTNTAGWMRHLYSRRGGQAWAKGWRVAQGREEQHGGDEKERGSGRIKRDAR